MTTITVSLPEERLQRLKEVALRFHVPPEELVRVSIEDLLARPEEEFQRVVEYILHKNAELYRLLA
jgi:hypothetical protein